ncbi:unnamed protein product [Caenorhabditis brenneri]
MSKAHQKIPSSTDHLQLWKFFINKLENVTPKPSLSAMIQMYLNENPKTKWCPKLTEDYVLENMGDDLHKEDMQIDQKLTLFRDLKIIMLSDIEQFLEDKYNVLITCTKERIIHKWLPMNSKTSNSPLNPPATSSSFPVPPTNSLTTVPVGVTTNFSYFQRAFSEYRETSQTNFRIMHIRRNKSLFDRMKLEKKVYEYLVIKLKLGWAMKN